MNDVLLKQIYKKLDEHPFLRKSVCRIARLLEALIFGGSLRERLLVRMLGALHRSQFRREWLFFTQEPPHAYNQRWNGFEFTYGKARSPYCFLRGFLACEVIRDGDHLLDIGCGDAFFSNTFFSARCERIDAIDVDSAAIDIAKTLNCSPKINLHLLDAVREPFPSRNYDVIVWDGAIGHFSQSDLSIVLEKILRALSPSGIFVGSECLGIDGTDHLQYFDDESALALVFKPYFKHVLIRTAEYRIGDGVLRKEAYWRCTNELNSRHLATQWSDFTEVVALADGLSVRR